MLREHGVAAADRVNVHLTNRPEFYDLWFAAAPRGAILDPNQLGADAGRAGYALSHAGCCVSVT